LRSAIQLLQFYTAGRLGGQETQELSPPKTKRRKVAGASQEQQSQETEKEATPYQKQKGIDNSRDNSLNIFHLLGKFLYNKRLDSKTKNPEDAR